MTVNINGEFDFLNQHFDFFLELTPVKIFLVKGIDIDHNLPFPFYIYYFAI